MELGGCYTFSSDDNMVQAVFLVIEGGTVQRKTIVFCD